MNSKFLYIATVVISLASTLAMADEAPVSRDQVKAELRQAIATGTLRHTDYDYDRQDAAPLPGKSRAQVAVELAQERAARKALVGPLSSRSYNPYGLQALETSTLARDEVKQDLREAIADGTLQRTDYDDAALLARQSKSHVAGVRIAQRLKAKLARHES